MTAIACLRILLTAAETAGASVPPAHVEAAADLYLKHRWKHPRRYGVVAPLAFVLADTKAEQLDPEEMQALAVELETSLFPGRKSGQVCLMTFEGDENAVLQFASLSQAELAGLMAGRGYSGAPGHVQVITAEEIRAVPSAPPEIAPAPQAKPAAATAPIDASPKAKPAPAKPATPVRPIAAAPPPKPAAPLTTGWRAIYHLPTESIVGAALGHRADLTAPRPEEDGELLARDLTGLNDAQFGFPTVKSGEGALFLPLSFWNLTTPASQEAYKRRLSRYPLDLQPRLGATIYDTPREPSMGLLQQIRAFLQGSFAYIDLCISDPNFPVNTLPGDIASSITLELRDEPDAERIKAIALFASRQSVYRAKGVHQGVLGVRNAKELDACRAAGLAYVTGPAVSALLDKPPALGVNPADALPLQAA
ncbi:hypothetical protein [Caulobacter endophyticus]|uniref:hypothetical protein n=1 Tax=Caulobacter endophyticus TaxID=2172652 RepID=UPI00240FF3C1|nr:hypothetical protein [Caulobacter endophyticus]MDG2527734.1 hypothetical protein [Caulobacter endophyticus]